MGRKEQNIPSHHFQTTKTTPTNFTMTQSSITNNGSNDAFTQNVSPEIIAEQERIMKQIKEENTKRDHIADIQKSLTPEIIAEQEQIMNQIEEEKARGGHMAGTQNIERRELSIRHAVFC